MRAQSSAELVTNQAANGLLSKWPKHLRTPDELFQALRYKSRKLNLIKSPLASRLVLQFIGSSAYLLAHKLNSSYIENHHIFKEQLKQVQEQNACPPLERLPNGQHQVRKSDWTRRSPLITLSNHISCIDDPVLWAILLPHTYYYTQTESVRWVGAATDICFVKPWHSSFFSLGKTFPIIRGAGLQQPAMEFAQALLYHNQWLHLFPEGRVMRDDQQQIISNQHRGYTFKWGIARLILNYFKSSLATNNKDSVPGGEYRQAGGASEMRILPFYHLGMDKVLPIGRPYIPKFGRAISIYIRPQVITMNARALAEILRNQEITLERGKSRSNDEICLIKLTNYLEQEMEKLIEPAERFHAISLNKPRI